MRVAFKMPARTAPPAERLKFLLLAAVGVMLLAYVARVRPMQAETGEMLTGIESAGAMDEPDVRFGDAAYVESPERALSRFYEIMEGHLVTANLTVESRQARIEANSLLPATPLIFEGRVHGDWTAFTSFLAAVRASRPRIQIQRLILRRLEKRRQIEAFFEARALSLTMDNPAAEESGEPN